MDKIEFVQEYIDKCNAAYGPLEKRSLCYKIFGLFQGEIPKIEHYVYPDSSDCLDSLVAKLINYKCNLERENEIRKEEIEKLQLQKSITIQNTLSATATSTVTITIEQTISNILSIPKEDLPDEEKKKLVAELTDLEFAKGNEPTLKEKISNILKNIADKGFEVGKAVLPLVLEYMKNS